MAYKTLTIGTLVDRVKFQILGLGVTSTAADTEIQWALNSCLQDMVSRTDYPDFRKEDRIRTAADTPDVWLPADFDKMIEPSVRYEESPYSTLSYLSEQEFDEYSGREWLQTSSRSTVYNIRWRDESSGQFLIRFHPTPDAAYSIVFAYISMPARIDNAALTDNIDKRFPVAFHEALAYGAATRFPQYLSVSQLQMFNSIYERGIREMAQKARPVIGLVYQNKRTGGAMSRGLGGIYLSSIPTPEQ